MTNYMKKGATSKYKLLNCLQSGLVEMSVKPDSIGFLSLKNGLDGCVHVSYTKG